MKNDFTIEELNAIHLALITRERVIRKEWIPIERDPIKKDILIAEANFLDGLQKKACAAQLSKEFGFYVAPLPATVEA